MDDLFSGSTGGEAHHMEEFFSDGLASPPPWESPSDLLNLDEGVISESDLEQGQGRSTSSPPLSQEQESPCVDQAARNEPDAGNTDDEAGARDCWELNQQQSSPRSWSVSSDSAVRISGLLYGEGTSRNTSESREGGRVLTKTSHQDAFLHHAARAILAKYRFKRHTTVGENGPNVDLTFVQIPQTFKGFLKYDETLELLPRGATCTSNDLGDVSYIRDKNLPQPKKSPKGSSKACYLNATKHDLSLVDDQKVIQEGFLVKRCTTWKPTVTDAEVVIYQFFLVEDCEKVKALQAQKRLKPKAAYSPAAAGSGASAAEEHVEVGDTDSSDGITNGPCLCVALPKDPSPAECGKRKAPEISEQDIENWLLRYLVEQNGGAADENRKKKVHETLQKFLGSLRQLHVRWPDYVFENDFLLPSIHTILEQSIKQGYLPGVISETREGGKDGKREEGRGEEAEGGGGRAEIKNLLRFVEMYLHWFVNHNNRISMLELKAQLGEVKRTFESPRQEDATSWPTLFEGCFGGPASPQSSRRSSMSTLQQIDGGSLTGSAASSRRPSTSALLEDIAELAKIWAKKHCIQPQPYQAAATQECVQRNTIVCLPTGAGKTLVAIAAIDHFLVQASGMIALFLAPTRALVYQQAEAIRSFSKNLPIGGTVEQSFTTGVAELCGQKLDGWSKQHWIDCVRENRVLVGTPDVFKKALITNRFLGIKTVSVIVFDECHAAVGNSAMSEIMRYAVSGVAAEARPRIIGLTASFINGSVTDQTVVTKRKNLCETLQGTLFVQDVFEVQRRHFKQVKWEQNPLPIDNALTTAEAFVAPLLSSLQTIKRVGHPEKIARSAAHVLWQLGFSGFRFYMMEGLVIELEAAAKQLAELKGVDFVQQRTRGEALLDQIPEVKRGLNNRFESVAQTGPALVVGERTKKVEALLALLQTIQTSDDNGQGIIFCAQNCLVHPLKQLCEQLGLRVGAVAGVSHMTDARRRDVLKRFATQQLDLLVATNAVEEGLDIPDCRFVVRFDKFDTTKSHIQGSGRARMKEAAIYYFENDIEAEHQKEQLLDSVARDTGLDLAEEDLLADGSRWTIPGKYPYPSSSSAEEPESGLVLFSNCLEIFSEYCGKVLGPSGPSSFSEFLMYASKGQGSPANLQTVLEPAMILERCQFPSPEGWQDVCRAEVEDYWGTALVDQEKRFLFVAIVKMRESGFLDIHNEPSAHALQDSKRECPLPVFDSSVSLTPNFARAVEAAAAVATAEVWTEEDYTSKLNLECQRRFGNAFKLSDSYQQMPYQGGFVCTLAITATPAALPLTFSASKPYRAKKCARKCAAKLAFQALAEDATLGLVDSSVGEPATASPAASSESPTSRPEAGAQNPPAQDSTAEAWTEEDYTSKLNLECQRRFGNAFKLSDSCDNIPYQKGSLFLCTITITPSMTTTGFPLTVSASRPYRAKKCARQSAAKVAFQALTAMASESAPSSPLPEHGTTARVDAAASELASPAASLGSLMPGTPPPGQDFKSRLNLYLQKQGYLAQYQTSQGPAGVFTSVVVIPALGKRFDGQPCKSKKEAEQSAARAAWSSLYPDSEWVMVH